MMNIASEHPLFFRNPNWFSISCGSSIYNGKSREGRGRRGQIIKGGMEGKDDLGGGQWKVHIGRVG